MDSRIFNILKSIPRDKCFVPYYIGVYYFGIVHHMSDEWRVPGVSYGGIDTPNEHLRCTAPEYVLLNCRGMANVSSLSICPECKYRSVRSKELSEGGGVICTNPKCSYWFCF